MAPNMHLEVEKNRNGYNVLPFPSIHTSVLCRIWVRSKKAAAIRHILERSSLSL
jgi:hypothetical protein